MINEKRYQVCTWSDNIGADDKMDFSNKKGTWKN